MEEVNVQATEKSTIGGSAAFIYLCLLIISHVYSATSDHTCNPGRLEKPADRPQGG